ncbi:MAG: ABC transporter ATP-binding protein [Lachnospiraceae bacterium]
MEFYPRMIQTGSVRGQILYAAAFAFLAMLPANSGDEGGCQMALIQVDAVNFAYPGADRRTLDQISLSIDEEEYVVLCGGSGCGKTTFLRQLKPELTPVGNREGQILYKGQPLEAVPSDVTAMRIGYVQQNPENQIVTDTVWHELAFGLENMALPTPVIRRRVCEMASFFDMEDWFRKSTSELSGGQKQMVNLASVMAMDPEVLILDEPTSMLDPLAARNLLQVVKRINRELGVAVILCEHRLEEVFQDADRVIVMDKGQICRSGSPRQVAAELEQELEDVHASRKHSRLLYEIFGELKRRGIPVADKEFPISIRDGRRN